LQHRGFVGAVVRQKYIVFQPLSHTSPSFRARTTAHTQSQFRHRIRRGQVAFDPSSHSADRLVLRAAKSGLDKIMIAFRLRSRPPQDSPEVKIPLNKTLKNILTWSCKRPRSPTVGNVLEVEHLNQIQSSRFFVARSR
jgi:hypothetical protein